MLSDLRFAIGAVLAIALLSVTVFGLAATMHMSHQSKLSPIEASRMLAYTPEGRHRIFGIPLPRAESPFANIAPDPNSVLLRQPPAAPAAEPAPAAEADSQPVAEPAVQPVETAAIVPPVLAQPPAASPAPEQATPEETVAEPVRLPPPVDDADTVDERAVIDPPLPLDNDAPAQTVDAAPAASSPITDPESQRTPEPEPVSAPSLPVETAPAIPAPATPAPAVEAPAEPAATPEVQQVASIPVVADAVPQPVADVPSVTETREAPKAKRARRAARAKRPARRLAASPTARQFSPLFPLGPPSTSVSNANRPARGFWSLD